MRQSSPRTEAVMRRVRGDLSGPKAARRLDGEAAQTRTQYAGCWVGWVAGPQPRSRDARRYLSKPLAVVRLVEDASTLESVADRPGSQARGNPRSYHGTDGMFSRQRVGR